MYSNNKLVLKIIACPVKKKKKNCMQSGLNKTTMLMSI